jgi:hypothetical protein
LLVSLVCKLQLSPQRKHTHRSSNPLAAINADSRTIDVTLSCRDAIDGCNFRIPSRNSKCSRRIRKHREGNVRFAHNL